MVRPINALIIGYGEIGRGLYSAYSDTHAIDVYDIAFKELPEGKYDLLLIAIPYSDEFVEIVNGYRKEYHPRATIIFSTVPVGTTSCIMGAVHSPVEGKHPMLADSIRLARRWVGGYNKTVENFFKEAGVKPVFVDRPEYTEFMKLSSTTLYGLNIAYAKYRKEVCDKLGLDYEHIKQFDADYNKLYQDLGMPQYQRYILDAPPIDGIKGHCILENLVLLYEQYPSELIREIFSLGKHIDTIAEDKPYKNKTWLYCEHYGKLKTASQIGKEQGCTGENIAAIIKRRGIKIRKPVWTKEQDNKLIELSKIFTFKEIALKIDKTYAAVRTRAIKLGIQSIYDPAEQDEETRSKISATLQGLTIKEWEGFKRTTSEIIRKSEKYMEWRKAVFERDNYTCQQCGNKGTLNAHHIKQFAYYPELRFDVNNGLTLCEKCHLKEHEINGRFNKGVTP